MTDSIDPYPLELGFDETHCPDDPSPHNGDYRWYPAAGGLGLEVWNTGDWNYVGTVEESALREIQGWRPKLLYVIIFSDDRCPERAATLEAAQSRLLKVSGAQGRNVT